jgi:hypothetical protein
MVRAAGSDRQAARRVKLRSSLVRADLGGVYHSTRSLQAIGGVNIELETPRHGKPVRGRANDRDAALSNRDVAFGRGVNGTTD